MRASGAKEGAVLIESSLVIIMLCLILFGILQLSYVIAARDILNYSSIAVARSGSVGLNDFMLQKMGMYATIPIAGPMITPGGFSTETLPGDTMGEKWDYAMERDNTPESAQAWYEVNSRTSFFMAGNYSEAVSVLNYDNWMSGAGISTSYGYEDDGMGSADVNLWLPLAFPFAKAFMRNATMIEVGRGSYPAKYMDASATIEDHASFYLDDS